VGGVRGVHWDSSVGVLELLVGAEPVCVGFHLLQVAQALHLAQLAIWVDRLGRLILSNSVQQTVLHAGGVFEREVVVGLQCVGQGGLLLQVCGFNTVSNNPGRLKEVLAGFVVDTTDSSFHRVWEFLQLGFRFHEPCWLLGRVIDGLVQLPDLAPVLDLGYLRDSSYEIETFFVHSKIHGQLSIVDKESRLPWIEVSFSYKIIGRIKSEEFHKVLGFLLRKGDLHAVTEPFECLERNDADGIFVSL